MNYFDYFIYIMNILGAREVNLKIIVRDYRIWIILLNAKKQMNKIKYDFPNASWRKMLQYLWHSGWGRTHNILAVQKEL